MLVDLNGLIERFPYLNKKWVREQANAGVFPHIRPHYRLFLFDPEEVDQILKTKFRKRGNDDLDQEIAKEYFRKRKSGVKSN